MQTRSVVPLSADVRRGAPPPQSGARFVQFVPATYDAEAHTVEAVLSAGTRIQRWYGMEELATTPEAVDVTRVAAGLVKLLDSHNTYEIGAILGSVASVRFENGMLIGVLKFGATENAIAAEQMVARGELNGVSIGYAIGTWTLVEVIGDEISVWRATAWTLMEVSLISVPADPAAGVRSAALPAPGSTAAAPGAILEDDDMQTRSAAAAPAPATILAAAALPATPEVRTEPSAAAAALAAAVTRFSPTAALVFIDQARAFNVETQARTLIEQNERGEIGVEVARETILRAAAESQRAATGHITAGGAARVTRDQRDTMRTAITVALMHRFDPAANALDEAGREWRGMSLLDMARRNLEANGENVRGLGRRDIAGLALRAHSTSDFPFILSNVAGKTLRAGYTASPQTFKAWMRRATAPDFKQVTRLQLGGAPSFLKVPEGGEFKRGTVGEGKEVYALATYGRIFGVTRQVIINDDLDAFSRIPAMWGRAASDFESDAAYSVLNDNPNMGDGTALFHADHGNLAGAGAVPSEATVNAAEIAMGSQNGIEGRPINISPRWLITGRKDRVAAKKLVAAITAAKTGDVNVYQNAFDVIVESRLNKAAGAVPWYMAADYNQVDTVEYAYLEGDEGVFLEERMGFEVDGVEFKARLDFATKAIDSKGLYMNPGAA